MLSSWSDLPRYYEDEKLASRWEVILQLREEVNRVLETARREKIIGSSLQAAVDLYPDEELYKKLEDYSSFLPALLIVSSCRLNKPGFWPQGSFVQAESLPLCLKVEKAQGEKCQRCWVYSPTVGQDKKHVDVCSRCSKILYNLEKL
jgi:isoleucyl-tRNA synthetase